MTYSWGLYRPLGQFASLHSQENASDMISSSSTRTLNEASAGFVNTHVLPLSEPIPHESPIPVVDLDVNFRPISNLKLF